MDNKKIEKLVDELRVESKAAARWKENYMEDGRLYMAGYMEGLREQMDTIIMVLTDDAFYKKYVH